MLANSASIIFYQNGNNSIKNTVKQAEPATMGSLQPLIASNEATISAPIADQTVLVEYRIAGNVITERVT